MKHSHGLLPFVLLFALILGACDRERDTPSTEAPGIAVDSRVHSVESVPEPAAASGPHAVVPSIPDSGKSFTDLDKDMDSGISRTELATTEMLFQHFNEADTSGDGKLSYAEIERHRADMALEPQSVVTDGRTLGQMDKNGDGGVAREELWNNEMLYRHFNEADENQDGLLSAMEIDTHRSAMASGD